MDKVKIIMLKKEFIENKETLFSYISTWISILMPLGFAIFNLVLGLIHSSIWNTCISVYYFLLLIIRAILYVGNRYTKKDNKVQIKKIYIISQIVLFITNISLIAPISLLASYQKEVKFGMIPAIAMATYSTYKITMAIINYSRARKYYGLIEREKRQINLYDALVSILTLENALIMVNGGNNDKNMALLSMISSLVIYSFIVISSIVLFTKEIKNNKTTTKNEDSPKS